MAVFMLKTQIHTLQLINYEYLKTPTLVTSME